MVLVDLVVCTRACLALARSHFHSYFPLNFILRTSEIVAGDVKKLGIQFRINLSVEIPLAFMRWLNYRIPVQFTTSAMLVIFKQCHAVQNLSNRIASFSKTTQCILQEITVTYNFIFLLST